MFVQFARGDPSMKRGASRCGRGCERTDELGFGPTSWVLALYCDAKLGTCSVASLPCKARAAGIQAAASRCDQLINTSALG